MSVATKRGDTGETDLYLGRRVPKDHPRVEVFGSLDELCAFLGLARSLLKDKEMSGLIEMIQRELFIIGAEVGVTPRNVGKLKRRIDKSYVDRLDEALARFEKDANFEACCFYLPGENTLACSFDIARTVARRTERRMVTLRSKGMIRNPHILAYLNRLSDLLFVLSRYYEPVSRKLAYDVPPVHRPVSPRRKKRRV
jgi:cob(I)alamin adenosyltransferase